MTNKSAYRWKPDPKVYSGHETLIRCLDSHPALVFELRHMDRNLLSILKSFTTPFGTALNDPIYSRPCCTPPPPPPPRHMQKLMNSGRSVPRSKYSGDGNTACKNQTWHPVPSPAYSQLTKAGPVLLLFEGCFNGGTSQSRWNLGERSISGSQWSCKS